MMPGHLSGVLRKVLTGLLVAAVLLASGAQGLAAAAVHHHPAAPHTLLAPASAAAAGICVHASIPCHDRHQPAGAPCCVAGVCTLISAWLPAAPALPHWLTLTGAEYPIRATRLTLDRGTPPPIRPPEFAV